MKVEGAFAYDYTDLSKYIETHRENATNGTICNIAMGRKNQALLVTHPIDILKVRAITNANVPGRHAKLTQ